MDRNYVRAQHREYLQKVLQKTSAPLTAFQASLHPKRYNCCCCLLCQAATSSFLRWKAPDISARALLFV
ncbi:hypothetical protein DVH05_006838 [Phytophthora capsici]|nr:hypothetical protein DVH05_006838 [Phytophthora capsici]